METKAIRESSSDYEAGVKTKPRDPEGCAERVKEEILRDFPDVDSTTDRRGPGEFTLDSWGVDADRYEEFSKIYTRVTDMLVEDDVWVVVLPLPKRDSVD